MGQAIRLFGYMRLAIGLHLHMDLHPLFYQLGILFRNANFDSVHFSHLDLRVLYSWDRLTFNFTHLQYLMREGISTYQGSCIWYYGTIFLGRGDSSTFKSTFRSQIPSLQSAHSS